MPTPEDDAVRCVNCGKEGTHRLCDECFKANTTVAPAPITTVAQQASVWLAFDGEYEQRDAFAAFTTEALARLYSTDVEEIAVYDRPIRTTTRFARWLKYQDGEWTDEHPPKVTPDYPEWVGPNWNAPVDRADVLHYPAVEGNPRYRTPKTWVIVEGAAEAAVVAEVERLKARVEADPTWSTTNGD